MLVAMSLYRIILILVFNAETTQKGLVLLAGLVQDAGIVSLIGLVALGIGAIPSLHPYRSKRGKTVLLSFFSATAMLLALVYIFDLIFLKSLDTRLSSDVFVLFTDGKENTRAILNRNIKILPILLLVAFVGSMWWLLLNWLFDVLGMMDRVRRKSVRFQWQSITISIYTIFVITSIFSPRNVTKKNLRMEKIGTRALIWNPVQTITKH
jgi:hypothetical protein